MTHAQSPSSLHRHVPNGWLRTCAVGSMLLWVGACGGSSHSVLTTTSIPPPPSTASATTLDPSSTVAGIDVSIKTADESLAAANSAPQDEQDVTAANSLDRVKAEVAKAVDERVAAIDQLAGLVKNTTSLTAADATVLSSELEDERSGLLAIKTRVQGATDLSASQADAKRVVADYRILMLETPKVRLIVANDSLGRATALMSALSPQLKVAMDNAQRSGRNVANARTAAVTMDAQLDSAAQSIGSLGPKLSALQPAAYPENLSTLQAGRGRLREALTSAKTARNNLTTILNTVRP